MDGYVRPDNRAGVLVFDVTAEASTQLSDGEMGGLLTRAIQQFGNYLPVGLVSRGSPTLPVFRDGFVFSATRTYTYPGGTLTAAIGSTPNLTGTDRVIVAVVFGPRQFSEPIDAGTAKPIHSRMDYSVLESVQPT